MNRNRYSLLLQAIRSLRWARRALKDQRPADALAAFSGARHDFGVATGIAFAVVPFREPPSCRRIWLALKKIEEEITAEITRLHRIAGATPASRGELIADLAAGIAVLRSRDNVQITDAQVLERARNIVTGLIGNYVVRGLS